MSFPSAARQSAPLGELNTTPLIDVMLVLLVMFIVTIPITSHSVPVDLPSGEAPGIPSPLKNKIVITQQGLILWNAEPVAEADLPSLLTATAALKPEPQLILEPEANARYELTARVIRLIERSEVTNFGFEGNDRYRHFEAS